LDSLNPVYFGFIESHHNDADGIFQRRRSMSPTVLQSTPLKSNGPCRRALADHLRNHWQLWIWILILAVVNWPLWRGQVRSSLLFLPDAVHDGQWWRIISYPWVHLSWYHLLLDAGGFLLLWNGLEEKSLPVRLLYGMGAGAGSLLLALVAEPSISFRGLSGLSGIAHGLMAVSALEMLRHPGQRRWGWSALILVAGKSAYELWTGRVFFEFMHMGLCGQPLAACHAGGVIGGLLVFALVQLIRTPFKGDAAKWIKDHARQMFLQLKRQPACIGLKTAVFLMVLIAPLFFISCGAIQKARYYQPVVSMGNTQVEEWGDGVAVADEDLCVWVGDDTALYQIMFAGPIGLPVIPLEISADEKERLGFFDLTIWFVKAKEKKHENWRFDPGDTFLEFASGEVMQPRTFKISRFKTYWKNLGGFGKHMEERISYPEYWEAKLLSDLKEPVELWDLSCFVLRFEKPDRDVGPKAADIKGLEMEAGEKKTFRITFKEVEKYRYLYGTMDERGEWMSESPAMKCRERLKDAK